MTNTSSTLVESSVSEDGRDRVARLWRVTDRATFAAFRRSRERARVGAVAVARVDGPVNEPVRVAFSIGRGVGSAVRRNRVRRCLRAALAEARPAPGAYLVAVSAGAAEALEADLRRDVLAALGSLDAGSRP